MAVFLERIRESSGRIQGRIYTRSAVKASVKQNVSDTDGHTTTNGQFAGIAARLAMDAASSQVMELFAKIGVQAALLKGASLIGWLYAENVAPYSDVDLLIRPSDEPKAAEALESLGFERTVDDTATPPAWQEHGSEWHRIEDGVPIDLHRRLVGIRMDPSEAWEVLAGDLATMPIGGTEIPVLGSRARLLHVTLHAAQHGAGGGGRGRMHLERALEVFPAEAFGAAGALAAQLDATDAFAAGLRLVPAGAAMADELGLPTVGSVDAVLRASTPPPVALGFEQLAQARSLRARTSLALGKRFPPRGFLVHWDPRAKDSRRRLWMARVRRPFWVLRSTPAGFRAWWRARRAVRRS
jgi:hypothetical protein